MPTSFRGIATPPFKRDIRKKARSKTRDPEFVSRSGDGDRSIQRGTPAKTGLTPTVEDSVDQVVRHGVVLGDMLMALFAFPRALKNPCYLFEYSGHLF